MTTVSPEHALAARDHLAAIHVMRFCVAQDGRYFDTWNGDRDKRIRKTFSPTRNVDDFFELLKTTAPSFERTLVEFNPRWAIPPSGLPAARTEDERALLASFIIFLNDNPGGSPCPTISKT